MKKRNEESKQMWLVIRLHFSKNPIKRFWGELPWGPVVNNLPDNAGDTGLVSGLGIKIPHTIGQLNLQATRPKPMRSRAQAPPGKPTHCNEGPAQPR